MLTCYHQNNNDYQKSHYFHRLILFYSAFLGQMFSVIYLAAICCPYKKSHLFSGFGLWMCPQACCFQMVQENCSVLMTISRGFLLQVEGFFLSDTEDSGKEWEIETRSLYSAALCIIWPKTGILFFLFDKSETSPKSKCTQHSETPGKESVQRQNCLFLLKDETCTERQMSFCCSHSPFHGSSLFFCYL